MYFKSLSNLSRSKYPPSSVGRYSNEKVQIGSDSDAAKSMPEPLPTSWQSNIYDWFHCKWPFPAVGEHGSKNCHFFKWARTVRALLRTGPEESSTLAIGQKKTTNVLKLVRLGQQGIGEEGNKCPTIGQERPTTLGAGQDEPFSHRFFTAGLEAPRGSRLGGRSRLEKAARSTSFPFSLTMLRQLTSFSSSAPTFRSRSPTIPRAEILMLK